VTFYFWSFALFAVLAGSCAWTATNEPWVYGSVVAGLWAVYFALKDTA
jgi:hypothetical protein